MNKPLPRNFARLTITLSPHLAGRLLDVATQSHASMSGLIESLLEHCLSGMPEDRTVQELVESGVARRPSPSKTRKCRH
jgi:hypothetical protein